MKITVTRNVGVLCFCAVLGIVFAAALSFAQEAQEAKQATQGTKEEAQESKAQESKESVDAATTGQAEVEAQKKEEEAIKNMPLEERMNRLVSLDLRNIDVNEALKYIATKGYVNIVQTKNVSGRVTLSLEKVPLKDVFDLVLRTNGLAYVMQGDIFNVMTELEYKALYGKNFFDLRKVVVFRLKYAIPEQAFSLLDALKSDIGRVLVDQESGNVLIMDTPEKIAQMQAALEEFEKKNVVEVFTLKYAKAKDVEDILKTRLDAKKVGSVKADERNNQVVVQTLPERMEEIVKLVRGLDKPTKEVLIDAKIIKIRLDDQLDQGIQWEGIFGIGNKFGNAYAGTSPFAVNNAGVQTPTFQTRQQYLNSLGGQMAAYPFSGTTSSLNSAAYQTLFSEMHLGVFTNNRDLDTLIKYLDTIGKSQVLSTPKLVVVNNQEAKIHVGERQAYVTTTTTTGQSTSTISEEVTFVDVGIQLAVTATINDDGFITMKLRPEISSVSTVLTTPTGNKIPIIDTSLTETTVMMKDGTTLLIGGLRKEEKTVSSSQTPWLGKIPFLGFPFKKSTDAIERTELLVMITPHIITGEEFDVGDTRHMPGTPEHAYREYKSITADKTMLPESAPSGIQMKSYRDYSMSAKTDGGMILKGNRYDDN